MEPDRFVANHPDIGGCGALCRFRSGSRQFQSGLIFLRQLGADLIEKDMMQGAA